jgi:hypothetical protein
MRTFLELGNPRVEEIIDVIIRYIAFRFHPKSVVVSGGFGRGEPSVIERNGKLKFLSDCEVAIVIPRYVSQRELDRLSLSLTQKTGLEVVLHNSLRLCVYSWLNMPSLVSSRVWRPSIANYDLKYGSRVVFGENTLQNVPDIKPQSIPMWEGIRLMFNRMAASLRYFPINEQERDEAIYWINKVIIACQDALLLSLKRYHYSYKARNVMFGELFPRYFGELNERLSNFLPLAAKATDYKLNPEDTYPADLTELWFDTAEICDEVFRHIINKDMNITFDSYIEFQERYLKHPNTKRKYYLGINSLPLFHNAFTAWRMMNADSYRFPPSKLIANIGTPWRHIVYSLVPLVYFGLSREGKTDMLCSEQTRNIISLFKRLKPKNQDPLEEWKYMKEQVLELWHTLCY